MNTHRLFDMNLLLDPKARQIVKAFEGCLLMPVRPGVDVGSVIPPLRSWGDEHYLGRLATENVAVVLGRRSGGLFKIQFEDENGLRAFLQRNRDSRDTLITSHAGRPVIWHRTAAPRCASLELPSFTLQMAGNSLVLSRAGLHRTDRILNPASMSLISLESFDWGTEDPARVDVWLTTVMEGEMFRDGLRGGLIPMRSRWRSYLVRRLRPHVVYEALEHRFYLSTEAHGWRPISEDELHRLLLDLILSAPVGMADGKAKLGDAWVERLARQLRQLLPAGPAIVEARLRAFAQDCIRVELGSDVTVGELFDAYQGYCHANELPVVPKDVFQKLMPVVLLGPPWHRAKSKSVARPSGCQNGFRSLTLRSHAQQKFSAAGVVGVGHMVI
jgi:hypothetical protein